MNHRKRLAIAGLAIAAVLGAVAALAVGGARDNDRLGLLTTLPIYWSEANDIGERLDGDAPPHWARTALAARYELVPLDTLESDQLALLRKLLMAQPRPLSPSENVALDDWVRGGGTLLLFADPLLTEHSRFAIGDRRRPQDVVLLSPILARWGLELRFDDEQGEGERIAGDSAVALPVHYPGELELKAGGFDSTCRIERAGLIAKCNIGRGTATIVADAALLESDRENGAPTLETILDQTFRN